MADKVQLLYRRVIPHWENLISKLTTAALLITLAFLDHSNTAASAAATKIVIAHATINPSVTPLWITAEQGFFAKYGIDPEIVFVRSTSIMMAGLASNRIPVAYGGGGGILGVEVGGTGLKIVATFIGRVMNDLVAAPTIRKPQDLHGKTVGVQSIGGTNWVIANLWLEHFGLDPRRDNVRIIPAGEQSVRMLAMQTGKIDASALGTAYSHSLKNKGFIILGDSMNVTVPLTGSDIVATKSLEAISLGRRQRDLVYRVLKKYMGINEPKLLEFTYKAQFLDSIPAKPYPREDAVQVAIEDLAPTIPKLKEMRLSDFIDVGIMREIENEGFFTRIQAP
jgi:ABC-type amino acid transport substrate-binding protein